MSAIQCTLVAALLTLAAAQDYCQEKMPRKHEVEKELNGHLFECGYSRDYRPVTNHETSVQVEISLNLRSYTFDALEETLTMQSTIEMTWRDEYLHWEPTDYENIKILSLFSDKIWTPSMNLVNEVGETRSEWKVCNLTYKGQVSCAPDLEHIALCATDLYAWPYDTLTCKLFFGSLLHTGEEVNYTLSKNPINIDECENSPGWVLFQANYTWLPNTYGNSSSPIIRYELKFRREAAAEVSGTRGLALVVALLPLAAMLGGGARLPLALFGVAAHMMALNDLSYLLPRHGDSSPRLLLACRTSMLVAAGGVLAALLLAWLRARPTSAPPLPRVLATLVRIASNAPVNHFVFADLDFERQTLAQDEEVPETSQSQWLDFANLLDVLFCIIALIIYAVLVFA